MSDLKVSVIIPAYNEGKRIVHMLKSIRLSEYEDLEIIVVNDGSTDSTEKFILKCAEKDPRIIYVRQQNGGVSSARNNGLEHATGDYVCFYDADDYVPRHGIAKLVERAVETKADLIVGRMRVVDMGTMTVPKFTKNLAKQENISRMDHNFIFSYSLANKMFSRKVIEENHLRFIDIGFIEDQCFQFDFLSCCGRITGCPTWVYRYDHKLFWKGKSLSQQISKDSLADAEKAFDHIIGVAESMIAEAERSDPDDAEMAGRLERYRSRVYRRALNPIVKQYYRYIWDLDDEALGEVRRLYNKYYPEMASEDVDILMRQCADLELEKGIRDKEEFLKRPIVTIVIPEIPECSENDLGFAEELEGIYRQEFPAFELIVDENMKQFMKPQQLKRLNLKLIRRGLLASDIRKKALKEARGEFVLFIDRHTIPNKKVIKDMYNHIGNADYIVAPVMYMKDSKFEMSEDYSRMTEAGETFSYRDFTKLDGDHLFNKLIRVSSLRGMADDVSRNRYDMIWEKLTCGGCVENTFIVEADRITDADR